MKKLLAIIIGVCALCFIMHFFKVNALKQKAFEERESIIKTANECLLANEWKCAEESVLLLLKETPQDKNLQMHMAGILLEEERYDDCIAWISSLTFNNDDLKFMKEKAIKLKQEMAELSIESTRHFRLEFEGNPQRKDILEALTVLEVAYDSLCSLFDFYPENKMPVVLYSSDKFKSMGKNPDWVMASFDGKLRIPLHLMEKQYLYRPVLFHELTHSFIRAMAKNKVPLWLNEGIAQTIDNRQISTQRPTEDIPTLDELSRPFVEEKSTEKALLLYWCSKTMVEKLLQINSSFKTLRDALQAIGKGEKTDDVLKKYYKTTADSLRTHL